MGVANVARGRIVEPMAKYVVALVALLLLAVAGFYALKGEAPQHAPEPQEAAKAAYATSTFSITYPSTYAVDDSYAYMEFKGKPIAGVKFSIPQAASEGTNLFSDSYLSVEWLPRAKRCTGDIYLVPDVKPFELTVGSTTYSVATTTYASAGSVYEEQVYAVSGSKPCTAVRYFIHSGDIGNADASIGATTVNVGSTEGAVQEFDRAALIGSFDEMRDSLILSQ